MTSERKTSVCVKCERDLVLSSFWETAEDHKVLCTVEDEVDRAKPCVSSYRNVYHRPAA
jgi:hypothetical protein